MTDSQKTQAIDQVATELETPEMTAAIAKVAEMVTANDPIGDEIARFAGQDAAASYFGEIVRERLEKGIVDRNGYVLEMRRELDEDETAIQEAGFAGELQTDQVVEKMARVERKRQILTFLADELSALPAKTELELLEDRVVELNAEIETMRADQVRRRVPGNVMGIDKPVFAETASDHAARMAAWRERWGALFVELRETEKAIAEATPLSPAEARALAAEALEGRAASQEELAATHGMGPGYFREALALRKIAAILADDGSSPYRIVVKEDQAVDLAAELIGQGIPQGKAHRIANAVANR